MNGRKFSKQVENNVGKGVIARYEQFLLFPQCFQKAYFPGASKGVIVWEWVNPTQSINEPYSLKPFDLENNQTISKGKSSHLDLSLCILFMQKCLH